MRVLSPLLTVIALACSGPPPARPAPEERPKRAMGPAPDPVKVQRAQARFRYRDGLKHIEGKRLDDALASFRDAERLDAKYADPHRMISGVLFQQGDRPAACTSMRRYVELAKTPEAQRARLLEGTCGAP